jgi:hypothetical protein
LQPHAAERGVSVSRFAGEVLRERLREAREHDAATRRIFARRPFAFEFVEGYRASREELHERARIFVDQGMDLFKQLIAAEWIERL